MSTYIRFIKYQQRKTNYVVNENDPESNAYPDHSSTYEFYIFDSIRIAEDDNFEQILPYDKLEVGDIFYVLLADYEYINPNNNIRTIDLEFVGAFKNIEVANTNENILNTALEDALDEYTLPGFDPNNLPDIILSDDNNESFSFRPVWYNHLNNPINFYIIPTKFEG